MGLYVYDVDFQELLGQGAREVAQLRDTVFGGLILASVLGQARWLEFVCHFVFIAWDLAVSWEGVRELGNRVRPRRLSEFLGVFVSMLAT